MDSRNIFEDILEISLPIIGELIIYTFMWIIDMMMIGKYGGNLAVTASGLSDEILYTFADIFISVGICIGICSLVSRKVGGRQWEYAKLYAAISINIGIVISIALCLILYLFCDKILIFAGAKKEVLYYASIYTKFSLPGIFFSLIISIISSTLRGCGNTKTPFFISLIVCILKLLLDLVLIFNKLNLNFDGLIGAAIATTISQFIGLCYLFRYLFYTFNSKANRRYFFSIRIHVFKEILFLSIPSSMEEAAFAISKLLSNFMILHTGTIAFAANQIANSVESLSFMPGIGFGLSATTMVGFCVGNRDFNKGKKYAYATTFLATSMMLFCSGIFILIPSTLVSIFINANEKGVIALATQCLILAAIEQPSMAISLVFGGALKGYGDTKSPFLVYLITSWCIRIPLIFYFVYIKKCTIIYVWWITAFQWTLNAIFMYILFIVKYPKDI